MKTLFALTVLSFGLLIPQPALPAGLEELITEAYLSMLDADKLLKEDKPAEALKLYKAALQSYQALKEQDPAYKPENVDYRINQIKSKVEQLSQKLPGAQTSAPASEPENTGPAEQDFKALYFQTREKMVADSSRLLDMEKRNIQMTVTLRERQQELENLRKNIKAYEQELSAAKAKQSESSAALEKEVRDLSRFNNLLQDRADKLEITSAQLEKQRDDLLEDGRKMRDELIALQEAHSTLQDELKETKRVTTLNEQTWMLNRNQLQDDLEAKKTDLGKAEEKIAQLQGKLKDTALLEETVIELNRQNEAQLKQISDLQTELAAVRGTVADKESAVKQAETAHQQTKTRLEELQQENADRAADLASVKSLNTELQAKLADTGEVISGLRNDIKKSREEKEEAEKERAEVLSKRDEYRDEMKAIAGENKDLKKEVSRLEKMVDTLQSDKTKRDEELAGMKSGREADLSALEQKLETKTKDMEILAEEISKLRSNLSKETVAVKQMEQRVGALESKLEESEIEKNRLALNLQQETDQRKLLERNAEQQLKSITDRMNEIISLRQQISKLETALKKARDAE